MLLVSLTLNWNYIHDASVFDVALGSSPNKRASTCIKTFSTRMYVQNICPEVLSRSATHKHIWPHMCIRGYFIQQYVYACRATMCLNGLQRRCYFACCVCPASCRTGWDRMHCTFALSWEPNMLDVLCYFKAPLKYHARRWIIIPMHIQELAVAP